jgi:alanyl-tRNA synthetase
MAIKNRQELIKTYINFFKKNKHKEIPNSTLVPLNDPTVLFTTAGMHPLVPYLMGQKHPLGTRLVNVQKCIRTGDIDEVGDEGHLTFFEMLGNWSLGDYFKKEAINLSYDFLTKELGISKNKLSVTCFKGDKDAPKDTEAANIWKSLGINKIEFLPKSENWWGPAGETGPCGPDSEMFVNGFEIWNDVFMQYNKTKSGKYLALKQKNVDTGMGVERIITILNGYKSVYETSMFQPIIKEIEKLSDKKNLTNNRSARIIADHIKAAVMIINDGVVPSNVEQGYVLRRLIRRAVRNLKNLGVQILEMDATVEIAKTIIPIYPDYKLNKKLIFEVLKKEETQFQKTLEKGLREFEKMAGDKKISGKEAFLLFQSYGFPLEMTEELAKEKKIKVDKTGFEKELAKHQKLSRTASAGKFKSGLADNTKETRKLHTATHLLNQALREVINKEIKQKGSNINPERLRFDFNFDRKLTDEEKKKIEDWVNNQIKRDAPIISEELPLKKALKSGAQAEFGAKYPEKVTMYIIGKDNEIISKEICTGPHADHTSELGKFKIIKEESSAAGIRRIKAVLE